MRRAVLEAERSAGLHEAAVFSRSPAMVQLLTNALRLSKRLCSVQTARFKRKTKVAQFRVFELKLEGPHLTATFRPPFDLLAITNTTWQRKRPRGVSSGL